MNGVASVQEEVEHRGVEDGWSGVGLPGGGRAGYGEDPRTDHGADAERSQTPRTERFAEATLGSLRGRDQCIDAFDAAAENHRLDLPLVAV